MTQIGSRRIPKSAWSFVKEKFIILFYPSSSSLFSKREQKKEKDTDFCLQIPVDGAPSLENYSARGWIETKLQPLRMDFPFFSWKEVNCLYS